MTTSTRPMTVLDRPDQMLFAHLASVKMGLSVEVATGLRHSRGSVLNVARACGYTNRRTKKGALEQVTEIVDALLDSDRLEERLAARYCPEHTDIADGYWPPAAWYCPACGRKTRDAAAERRDPATYTDMVGEG